jgi:tRNA splicing ligase
MNYINPIFIVIAGCIFYRINLWKLKKSRQQLKEYLENSDKSNQIQLELVEQFYKVCEVQESSQLYYFLLIVLMLAVIFKMNF